MSAGQLDSHFSFVQFEGLRYSLAHLVQAPLNWHSAGHPLWIDPGQHEQDLSSAWEPLGLLVAMLDLLRH